MAFSASVIATPAAAISVSYFITWVGAALPCFVAESHLLHSGIPGRWAAQQSRLGCACFRGRSGICSPRRCNGAPSPILRQSCSSRHVMKTTHAPLPIIAVQSHACTSLIGASLYRCMMLQTCQRPCSGCAYVSSILAMLQKMLVLRPSANGHTRHMGL